jgi:ketosteroid isomerase-like protein
MRAFRSLAAALAVAATVSPALAQMGNPPPPDPALTGLPAKLITAFIAGDAAKVRANCAASAVVVDEFPPYAWSGPGACAAWVNGFREFAAQVKLTNPKGSVDGTPFVDVSGTRAYMTARVRFDATIAGKPVPEEGSWTMVLVKSGGAWKITNMAFGVLHH